MFLDYAGEFQTDQMTGCLEQFSVEFWEPKPKWSWQPIGVKVDIIASSWVLKLKTGTVWSVGKHEWPNHDWFKFWTWLVERVARDFWPITEQSSRKRKQSWIQLVSTQLKTAFTNFVSYLVSYSPYILFLMRYEFYLKWQTDLLTGSLMTDCLTDFLTV